MATTDPMLRLPHGPQQAIAALFDEAPFMMHSIDTSGRLVDVNRRWLEVMGYERDEVIGRRSTSFLTEESRAKALRDTLPLFWSAGSARGVAYQLVTKEGMIIDAVLDADVVPGDLGGPVTIAVIRAGWGPEDWRLARSILAALKSLVTTWQQSVSVPHFAATLDELGMVEVWRPKELGNDLSIPRPGEGPDALSAREDEAATPDRINDMDENPPAHRAAVLTPRELDVLRHLRSGLRNKEIADQLSISVSAVKFHTENLYSKLGTHTRSQTVRVATESGLLDNEALST